MISVDDMKEAVKRAEKLSKVAEAIDDCLKGLDHHEAMSILTSLIQMRIMRNDHELEEGVIAEMAMIFAKMIISYKFINNIDDDDEESDEEEMTKQ